MPRITRDSRSRPTRAAVQPRIKKSLKARRSNVIDWRIAEELLPDGTFAKMGREKGIDVRIAIDVLTLADKRAFDVGLIFSQDQDLAEVVPEILSFARRQTRWIKTSSAFPIGPGTTNRRGINKTDWVEIDQAFYDRCLDPVRN